MGESKYNQLFGPGGQLEGYFVYSMTLNGTEVTEEGLRPVAREIGEGKRSILETIIVDESEIGYLYYFFYFLQYLLKAV